MTTNAAIRIEISTENGTTISIGIKRVSNGTVINDCPKPKVERTNVAIKIIAKM
jgi:hypothetical protein